MTVVEEKKAAHKKGKPLPGGRKGLGTLRAKIGSNTADLNGGVARTSLGGKLA